jgi:hypothetical protein
MVIVPIGDMHVGSINCDKRYLKNTIRWIGETENAYWIGMGDYADYISSNDPRFVEGGIDPEFCTGGFVANTLMEKEVEYIEKLLYDIRDRCLGIHAGNHEMSIYKYHHFDLSKNLARSLNVPYLGLSAISQILWDKTQFHTTGVKVFSTHGNGSSTTSGGKINRLIKMSQLVPNADLYLMGHNHDKITCDDCYPDLIGKQIRFKKRIYACTGTFLRTYQRGSYHYGEAKGYKPTKTGVVRIDIYPQKKPTDIHVRV